MEERFQKQAQRINNIAKKHEQFKKGEEAKREKIKERQEEEVKRFHEHVQQNFFEYVLNMFEKYTIQYGKIRSILFQERKHYLEPRGEGYSEGKGLHWYHIVLNCYREYYIRLGARVEKDFEDLNPKEERTIYLEEEIDFATFYGDYSPKEDFAHVVIPTPGKEIYRYQAEMAEPNIALGIDTLRALFRAVCVNHCIINDCSCEVDGLMQLYFSDGLEPGIPAEHCDSSLGVRLE